MGTELNEHFGSGCSTSSALAVDGCADQHIGFRYQSTLDAVLLVAAHPRYLCLYAALITYFELGCRGDQARGLEWTRAPTIRAETPLRTVNCGPLFVHQASDVPYKNF